VLAQFFVLDMLDYFMLLAQFALSAPSAFRCATRLRLTGTVQDVSHARRKIRHAEGLCNELYAGIEAALMDNRVTRVPGRKEHLQIRLDIARLRGDLRAR
jgi:hypothetical protein